MKGFFRHRRRQASRRNVKEACAVLRLKSTWRDRLDTGMTKSQMNCMNKPLRQTTSQGQVLQLLFNLVMRMSGEFFGLFFYFFLRHNSNYLFSYTLCTSPTVLILGLCWTASERHVYWTPTLQEGYCSSQTCSCVNYKRHGGGVHLYMVHQFCCWSIFASAVSAALMYTFLFCLQSLLALCCYVYDSQNKSFCVSHQFLEEHFYEDN